MSVRQVVALAGTTSDRITGRYKALRVLQASPGSTLDLVPGGKLTLSSLTTYQEPRGWKSIRLTAGSTGPAMIELAADVDELGAVGPSIILPTAQRIAATSGGVLVGDAQPDALPSVDPLGGTQIRTSSDVLADALIFPVDGVRDYAITFWTEAGIVTARASRAGTEVVRIYHRQALGLPWVRHEGADCDVEFVAGFGIKTYFERALATACGEIALVRDLSGTLAYDLYAAVYAWK